MLQISAINVMALVEWKTHNVKIGIPRIYLLNTQWHDSSRCLHVQKRISIHKGLFSRFTEEIEKKKR